MSTAGAIIPYYDSELAAEYRVSGRSDDEIVYNDLAYAYGMRDPGVEIIVDEPDYREIVYHGRLYICTVGYRGCFIIRRSCAILVDSLEFGMALVLPNSEAGFTQCLVTHVKKSKPHDH